MIYTWSFFAALAIFVLGAIFRITGFFRLSIGPSGTLVSPAGRVSGFASGLFQGLVYPARLFRLIRTFILDVLFQVPLLVQDPVKWLMHICIFWGFAWLFFFHALEASISRHLFANYESTLNPFMFLRNFAGVMVVVGLAIAAWRRKTHFRLKMITRQTDYAAIVLLAVIMISGFCLEASKIISSQVFDEMMTDWGDMVYEDEIPALQVYWQEEFKVCFPGSPLAVTPDLLEQGEALNEENCAGCHVKPQWAFVSYPISRAMAPAAKLFNRYRLDRFLWVIHFLSCFMALAYLPFSKFLHIITSPVSLMVRGMAGQAVQRPENRVTRQVFDLHACTQCGTCTLRCAVAPVHEILGNAWVFPSERLTRIRDAAWGKSVNPDSENAFSQGSFICTQCNKCSQVCPAGLDLQDIWGETRNRLDRDALPDPEIIVRRRRRERRQKDLDTRGPIKIRSKKNAGAETLPTAFEADTFSGCYTCLTCTNSCPVVAASDGSDKFGAAPHQVIHWLSLGRVEQAMNMPMIWNCLTCYQCQENCPQGVRLTDIFYQLKNKAHCQEFNL